MWDQVKPITLLLEQENEDGSSFIMHFYSHDYDIVKLQEATHINADKNLVGTYSRLLDAHIESSYTASFFIERLSRNSVKKMVEYYENPRLFVEYLI
jgi:hypothetical protein